MRNCSGKGVDLGLKILTSGCEQGRRKQGRLSSLLSIGL